MFSPTMRGETFRTALGKASSEGWSVYHFDVETAFLNANLEEEVYMTQVPGFESKQQGLVLRFLFGLPSGK